MSPFIAYRLGNFYKNKKERINFDFKFFFKKAFLEILALSSYKIFLYHLSSLNTFIKKKSSKFVKLSRKDRFRKMKEGQVFKLSIKKSDLNPKGGLGFFEKFKKKDIRSLLKPLSMAKLFRLSRSFIHLNLLQFSVTKKSSGMRMGRGKGSVRAVCNKVRSGWPLLYLVGWDRFIGEYISRSILSLLPGKNFFSLLESGGFSI